MYPAEVLADREREVRAEFQRAGGRRSPVSVRRAVRRLLARAAARQG